MDTTPSNYIYSNQIKMMDMSLQLSLLQWGLKPGLVAVFDMEGTSFAHLFRINPITSKRLLDYVQEALPVRLKAVHLINVNKFTAQFIQLMKPFMKKYLGDLFIRSHSQEALPEHLGGNAGTIEDLHALQIKNLQDHAEFFLEDDKLKCDETKRDLN
ncbi:alpha-tocopherol transfer protein-related [Holotrichia oblita]|uniref:Alpha-tocopherol transfer protein-related n=1 Tax=Holotrichia oblita TaxID=644536 RepID=A0ACB9SHY7_HOLOL|nr:alpha-tocopherol transfer protein-related [Holotrichia oblita]